MSFLCVGTYVYWGVTFVHYSSIGGLCTLRHVLELTSFQDMLGKVTNLLVSRNILYVHTSLHCRKS